MKLFRNVLVTWQQHCQEFLDGDAMMRDVNFDVVFRCGDLNSWTARMNYRAQVKRHTEHVKDLVNQV